LFTGAGNRVSPFVKKFLDSKDHFDVLPLINAVSGFRLSRGEVGELRFPKPEDERLDIHDLADFSDTEEEPVRDLSC